MLLYDFDMSVLDDLFGSPPAKKPEPKKIPQRSVRWFSEQPGFGVREYPSGRSIYFVQCQTSTGRRTITLGNTKAVSKAVALDVARRCIFHSETAANPADERKRVRRTPKFQDYLNDYWSIMYPQWKPSTQYSEDKFRRLYLTDAFLDKGVDEITYEDVSKWMVEKTRKGSPGAVNHAFQRLNAAMRKAEDWGYRPEGSNPCCGIRQNPRRKMERFLNEQEFARLGEAIGEGGAAYRSHAAALMLLLLTGCRKEEIVGLTWGEVKGSRIYLDDSKTGARVVYLPSHAQAILASFPRGKPAERVFRRSDGRPLRIEWYWERTRARAGLENVRLHDVRHSYASLAARASLPLPTVQRLLGHARLESTARYTHFDDRHLIVTAQQVSDLIERAMEQVM